MRRPGTGWTGWTVRTAAGTALTLLLGLSSVRGDYCEVNVCLHGGTCVTGVGDEPFICICADGFGGDSCRLMESGPCSPNPCKNEGSCKVITPTRRGDVFSEYVCECQSGFEGVHCQTDVDGCSSRPCRNGAACRDLQGDFACRCASPYVGKQCQLSCVSLLGMEGGAIGEAQISASSLHYGILGLQRWGPELAGLNNQGLANAWTASAHDRNPWIEVNMQKTMRLTGIITQGASRMGAAEYVKAFKVASSSDGTAYTSYREDGQRADKVFIGNTDNDGTKTNLLDPPILAQYVRIIPVVCRRACTLRLELVGCELHVSSHAAGCSEPLGMKSRLVSDGQLSASSSFRTWGVDSFTWRPQFARLDRRGKTNAWSPAHNNRSEWLQVDLEKTKRLTGIITQGAKDFGVLQFVTLFKVTHSCFKATWITPPTRRISSSLRFPPATSACCPGSGRSA
ncbi:EGF-like repeat and discoidin I-like domain-containing protein 3 isoform X1 [Pseudoliparis swirei]|uniref:EGF-like repeat and discoidin I-like domain-containing protein 3 isoform X1 n=1 Tax=Pseudoliparis swirei TaxID=2059687 RepID=UPI0024BF0E02|nr:EGF-like repeat and discoidin I-like domain-containing protein 3 isoform X1 [Pseudoliparis swirei]